VDLVADENDPTNAITSWKYNVQQVELYADKVKIGNSKMHRVLMRYAIV